MVLDVSFQHGNPWFITCYPKSFLAQDSIPVPFASQVLTAKDFSVLI